MQSSFIVAWDSNSPNCLQVVSQQEAVVTLSVEASQEAALEDLLDHISSKWNSIDFSLIPFKDVKDAYILGSVEDVTAALEDSMVTMSAILASRQVQNTVEWHKLTGTWSGYGGLQTQDCQQFRPSAAY